MGGFGALCKIRGVAIGSGAQGLIDLTCLFVDCASRATNKHGDLQALVAILCNTQHTD